MQDLNNHSATDLGTSTDDNVGLQIAEYVVAAGAVVGTVASFVTKYAAIAAVPLTASVFLNLLNRQRLDQLTRQRTFADTTEVQRRLTAEIQSLRSQVEGLPASQERSDYNNVKVSITSLSASVAALEQQMMDLQSAGQQQQPLEAISAMEAEINQLREYHIDLTQSIEALQSQISTDSEAPHIPGNIHQELTTLQNAVAQLSQQTAPASPAQEAQLVPVYDQIEDVKVKMDAMLANISEEMEIARGAMENTQQQVNEVQHQLGVVQQGTTHTSNDLNPDNLHQQLQATLGPLQDQIGQLESRINAIPTIDPSVTQRQEEQLQGLQHHLQDLSNRLEILSTQFSAEMANLPSMVSEQVQHHVSEIREHTTPQVDAGAKQDQFTELDSLLADLS